jgi:hypothetical protein
LKTITAHFRRSINLAYDAADTDYVKGYIPTLSGTQALASLLAQAIPQERANTIHQPQRAHVLHAAYGSGKSLLGLVLAALALHADDQENQHALALVMERIQRHYPEQAETLLHYQKAGPRLLPVLLTGDEGRFIPALTRVLTRTLAHHHLQHIQPHTRFQAALQTITRWQETYPDTYHQFAQQLRHKGHTVESLQEQLTNTENQALELFAQMYPDLTAGSHFDQFAGPPLEDVFHATAQALHEAGYAGILIIWDEFGRFLEARPGDTFGPEAARLQSFAEFCNRSGKHQVHLVLITHLQLAGYATNLPQHYQHEWARVAERFRSHDVSGDPTVAYELMTEALTIQNQSQWKQFVDTYHDTFEQLALHSLDHALFETLDDTTTCQNVIEQAWPLHPLTLYALPRLANRVAQNERTLFTFLAADEPGTLYQQLQARNESQEWWLVKLDTAWDYFAEAIRADTQAGGTHFIWSGAMYALSKVEPDDTFSRSLVKAMAVLLIVSEVQVQTQAFVGRATPTTDILSWALNASPEKVETCLRELSLRRAVVFRRADGYWTFTRGSDVDLDAELKAILERHTPTQTQMLQVLKHIAPPPFHLPRQHNLHRGLIRFFWGIYRWCGELPQGCHEEFLKQHGTYGYADGAVIYVLVTNDIERQQAIEQIQKRPDERAVYVVPDYPLKLELPIQEIFALQDLQNNDSFMQQDERLASEIAFFLEDAQRRLIRVLQPLLDPDRGGATWWHYDGTQWCSGYATVSDVSRFLSTRCDKWFHQTPVIKNEMLNQYHPSSQQVRAAEAVINALIQHPGEAFPINLNIRGGGPDYLIVRTLLVGTKLLQERDDETWHIVCPQEETPLRAIWDTVQEFLDGASGQEQPASLLLDKLQSPPFGLRRGVLPVLLATCMHARFSVLMLRHHRQVITSLDGAVFTDLCQHPDRYTIEVGPWDERRRVLWEMLEEQFRNFILEQELTQQPVNYLSAGLTRWFHVLSRYCRDTHDISQEARRLREHIRTIQRNPVQVLLYDLPALLEEEINHPDEDLEAYRNQITNRLARLKDEITSASNRLLYLIDHYIQEHFAADMLPGQTNAQVVLNSWLIHLEQQSGRDLNTLGFNDYPAQNMVRTIRQSEQQHRERFLDTLAQVVSGLSLYDWNDDSVITFQNTLLDLKQRVEREVLELTQEEHAVTLQLTIPGEDAQDFRFRPSELSPQGQRILQNFKSTLDIAGRPLSPDERRQIVIALLHTVLNEST